MHRLAHLPHARGPHATALCGKFQHARIPCEPEKPANHLERRFGPVDQVLVLHLEDLVREQRFPVAHQFTTAAQMVRDVAEIRRVGKLLRIEMLEEDRKTRIDAGRAA